MVQVIIIGFDAMDAAKYLESSSTAPSSNQVLNEIKNFLEQMVTTGSCWWY